MGFADNGLLTMVYIANLLAASGRPLSELIRPLDRYPSTGEINLRVSEPAAVLAVLAARYRDADLDRLDGLTVSYPAWWFNIRRSHTEPVVRLNLEAETGELLEEKRREVLSVIRDAEEGAKEV
jgi:phosphomannomutase